MAQDGGAKSGMVNTIDKNTPTSWSVEEGKQKNIKWVAALGNHAYGGPVIADGKLYLREQDALHVYAIKR